MSSPRRVCALLLAAGAGRRAGGPKQFRRAGGKSLLEHAARGLLAGGEIESLVVVVPESDVDAVRHELERIHLPHLHAVVAGGATRHLSSRRGVEALPEGCDWVLIHDAARPFASRSLIRRVLRAAEEHRAAIPAIPVHDSTVRVGRDGRVEEYLPRPSLRSVQTPQAFERGLLEDSFRRVDSEDFTDDASVVVAAGHPVFVVAGEHENRKLTTGEEVDEALGQLTRRG